MNDDSVADVTAEQPEETRKTDEQAEEQKVAQQEASLSAMLGKDALLLLSALALWGAADTWYQVSQLSMAVIVSAALGLLVGMVLIILAHEWGHYGAARLAGAHALRVDAGGFSVVRAQFDLTNYTNSQFYQMTAGAHIVQWLLFVLLLGELPLDSPARVALMGSIFGFLVFSAVFEIAVVKSIHAGMTPKEGLETVASADNHRSQFAGLAAGLLFIFVSNWL